MNASIPVRLLVIACFALACARLSAQSCLTIEWERTIGGSDNDVTRGAVVMPDGRYVIAGATNSPLSGEVSEPSYGGYDAWAVCLLPDGTIDWERRYGGSAGEQFEDVAVTLDGGLIFVGLTISPVSGMVSQPSFSESAPDYWVVRTDAWGNLLWERRFGGSDIDEARNVIARDDGTFLVSGYSYSPVSGNKTAIPRGSSDYWVVAIDAFGNKLWDACYGGSSGELPHGMAPRIGGGAVITGYTSSPISGDISEAARGPVDLWSLAIDATGTKLWEKRLGGSQQDFPYGGVARIGSSYFIGCQTNSPASGDLGLSSHGLTDALGLWVDGATGTKQFETRPGGSFVDACRSVAIIDPANVASDVVMAGQTQSPVSGTITGIPRGNWDYWLTIQTVNNATQGQFRCGSSGTDELTKVLITPDGGYLLVGMSGGNAGHDKSENNRGVQLDMWIVKIGPSLGAWWYADADGDGFGTPDFAVWACAPPPGHVRNNSDCDDTDPSRYTGAPCIDNNGMPAVLNSLCVCGGNGGGGSVTLPVVAGLEGPMDEFTGLMHDHLRVQDLIPYMEPYSLLGFTVTENAFTQVDQSVFQSQGMHAVVDWVLVELRTPYAPGVVVASRTGLLRRDGSVVQPDGAPFGMNVPHGDYLVALRHRNHLGVMTSFPTPLNAQTQTIDLGDPGSPVFGNVPRVMVGNRACLWSGDVNGDGTVMYVGDGNDRDAVLVAIGGSTPNSTVSNVYSSMDVNLDGAIKYVGADNDRDPILTTIGGSTPTNTRVQQLP